MDKGLRQQPRDGRDARAWHRSCRLPPQGSADPAHPDPLHETLSVPPLFETMRARGFAPETAALDKGYDVTPVYEALEAADCRPIIPLRMTPAVKSDPRFAALRAWRLDVRGCRLQAEARQVGAAQPESVTPPPGG